MSWFKDKKEEEKRRLYLQGADTGAMNLLLIPPSIMSAPKCPKCGRYLLDDEECPRCLGNGP